MNTVEPLFVDRTPEAAARQLAVVVATLAERHLEALSHLQSKKRASIAALERQRLICDEAVFHCQDLGVDPRGLSGRACPLLAGRIAHLRANPPTLIA